MSRHVDKTGVPGVSYGYYWWIESAAGHDVYAAVGHGGQTIRIVPDLNLVVVTAAQPNDHPCCRLLRHPMGHGHPAQVADHCRDFLASDPGAVRTAGQVVQRRAILLRYEAETGGGCQAVRKSTGLGRYMLPPCGGFFFTASKRAVTSRPPERDAAFAVARPGD